VSIETADPEVTIEAPERPDTEAPPKIQPGPHRDFVEKVAGTLRYADDWGFPGMLHGVVVRAQLPSARIVSIDTSAASAVRGVRAVMTAADIPHNGILDEASGLGVDAIVQPVLAADRVRYDGEPVALVAAETPGAAAEAASLVEVEYEDEPGVFDPEEALRDDAPAVHAGGNRYVTWRSAIGDVDSAMQSADVIVEETYRSQRVDHAYLEPEAGIGWIDSDGVITLRVSTQVIEHAREIAEILELPHSRVRVIAAYMGGGFGGKEDMTVEAFIALLVWKTRRPVRMVWTRQESLLARYKRHPFVMHYRTGVANDGTIVAQDVRIIGNAGAYPLLSSRVLFAAGVNSTGPYRTANARVESIAVFTNSVPTSAMRGFGAMQVVFAYESQMDRIAEKLGLDPAELRERNFVQQGDQRVTGETIDTGVGVGDCMRRALRELGEPTPADPDRPHTRIGQGFGCSMQPYGRSVFFTDRASAWIGLEKDGTMVIRAGVTDLGAGQAASLANIAGEVLGITVERTAVHIGDSALTPLTGGTFATRQLYMSGNAVLKVARGLREKLEPVAAALLECGAAELRFDDNRVWSGERSITIGELSRAAEHQSVMPYHHDTFDAETGKFDTESGRGRSFPDCTHGAHAVEVEVDTDTGEVRILKYVAVHDIGRAINMQRVEGQIQGAVAQGVGYALSEEVEVSGGVVQSTLFADYLIPTAVDLPDIKAIGLELHLGKGPFGARGIGEPPIGPPPAALASAIHDAVGVRLRQLPMTPERVLAALREARAGSATATP
jgi:CO/xanthine dehydrogenase Mo-binding subunit